MLSRVMRNVAPTATLLRERVKWFGDVEIGSSGEQPV